MSSLRYVKQANVCATLIFWHWKAEVEKCHQITWSGRGELTELWAGGSLAFDVSGYEDWQREVSLWSHMPVLDGELLSNAI